MTHCVRVPSPIDLVTAKLVRGDEADWSFAEFSVSNFSAVTWERVDNSLVTLLRERPDCQAQIDSALASVRARFGG